MLRRSAKENSYQGGWRLNQRSSSKKAPGNGTSSEHSYRCIGKREKFLNFEDTVEERRDEEEESGGE